jgi:alpha-1,3-rhamnosyltransferase
MRVTVAVTTYFSAPYIIETLESIFNQSYQDLALIISDDFSTDATLTLVNEWVSQEKNQKRFASIEVITVPKNTGVSANCNRCIAAAPTDWIKFIAGDDVLFPNCIEANMAFATKNPEAHILFSQVKVYQDTFEEKNYLRTTPSEYPNNLMNPALTANDQHQLLLVSDRIHYTPSYIFNKKALQKVGNYDETNRLVEDYPMWLKLTGSGEKLFYFHEATVGYRVHSKAANNVGDSMLFKPSVFNTYAIRKKVAHPYLPWEMVQSERYVFRISQFFQTVGWNKNFKIYSVFYRFACFYGNPFYYIYSFKKRMPRHKKNLFYS